MGGPQEAHRRNRFAPANIEELARRGFAAVCTNALSLDLKDNVSDFTFSQGVIHHTDNPFQAFRELVRITKPGGHIYLNLYNQWNPYFYLVHRATFPIRFIYWNVTTKIASLVYPIAWALFQPVSLLVMGELLGRETARTFFMDQVITPRAYLFSREAGGLGRAMRMRG